MIPCNALAAVWLTMLLVGEPIEHAQQHRRVMESRNVKAGMTAAEVRSHLGEPHTIYAYEPRTGIKRYLLPKRPTQWMYGTALNLDYLFFPSPPYVNPIPINLRIFEYAPEDLVIYWSDDEVVAHVRRPTFEADELSQAMLETVEFAQLFVSTFVLDQE